MPGTTTSHRSRSVRLLGTLAVASALVLAACGDDGAGVRDGGGASASGSGSGIASGSEVSGAECNPVGEDLADQADTTVEVELADYEIIPADISVGAGIVTFEVTNTGDEPHELAFLPDDGDVPFTDGHPDESALEDRGAFELEAFPAGETCTATYELEPGEYTLFCIVPAADGETHYEKGMRGTLTVN